MTQPTKPWQDRTPAEKLEAVRVHILAGTAYQAVADALGAPSKGSIASVVTRLRELGALPPAPTKEQVGAINGAISSVTAKVRRLHADHLHVGNIANKAESRKADPELKVQRALAFDPLPGVEPVPFVPNTGCKWPVDGIEGNGLLVCGAPRDGRTYCEAHKRLAYLPPPIRIRNRTAVRAVERLH